MSILHDKQQKKTKPGRKSNPPPFNKNISSLEYCAQKHRQSHFPVRMGANSSSSKIQRCQRRSNHQILPSFKKNTTASAKLPTRSGAGRTQKFGASGGTKFGPARTLCSSVWRPLGPIYWSHCRFLSTRKLFSGGNMGFILSYSLSAHPLVPKCLR